VSSMKCPKCNSENVQISAKTKKRNPLMLGCVLGLGGLGLMFLGPLGAILGVIIGLILGWVLKAIVPPSYKTVAVCQSCGYISQSVNQGSVGVTSPLFCTESESNLVLTRKNASCGSVIGLQLTIDGSNPFMLFDGASVCLKLEKGSHALSYEQLRGLGKKNRKGSLSVNISDDVKQYISIIFTPKGIDITQT